MERKPLGLGQSNRGANGRGEVGGVGMGQVRGWQDMAHGQTLPSYLFLVNR